MSGFNFSGGGQGAANSGPSSTAPNAAGFGQNKPLFGGGGATSGQGGQLFGGTGSGFGSTGSGAPGLFGSNQNTTPSNGSGAGSPFGGALGGAASNTTAASSQESSKPLFGAASGGVKSGGFAGFGMGAPAPNNASGSGPPASSGAGSAFSLGGTSTAGAGGFSAAPASTSAAGGGLFGNTLSVANPNASAPQQNKPASGLFGGGGLFNNSAGGKTMSQGQNGSSTPQANKAASPLSFSTTPAGPPPSGSSLFGGASKPDENQAPAHATSSSKPATFGFPSAGSKPGSLFGEVSQNQARLSPFTGLQGGSQSPGPSSTATSAAQGAPAPAAPSGSNLFGQNANSGSNLSGAQPVTSNPGTSAPSTSSGTTPGLFPSIGQSHPDASKPSGTSTAVPSRGFSGFTLAGGASSASSQPPAAATTSAPTGSSLFGAAPATSQSATATSNVTTANATTGTTKGTAGPTTGGVFGNGTTSANPVASTAGPAPPAHSRLAQKTMDEILTTWSTSLATHQKTFAALASQVSEWDRALVENSSAISSLYGRCFQAERDCTEVERQVSIVEHGQMELEHLLDRYESDVDKLIEGTDMTTDGLGGVDAEREKTYKAAELCSNRLAEMSHSLSDMIAEVNQASSKLSSTKSSAAKSTADDPLAQIVRVLNGHLTQLQTIDSGAVELQKKVEQAQKDARVVEGRGSLHSGGWNDDFGKSFLGRR